MPLDLPPDLPESHQEIGVDSPAPHAMEVRSDPDQVHFEVGNVDLAIGLGFSGNGYDPLTFFSAFLAWMEFRIVADSAVWETPNFTYALGLEAYYARPFLHEDTIAWSSDSGLLLDWRATEVGLVPRFTLHGVGFAHADPYIITALGPTLGWVSASTESPEGQMRYRAAGIRAAAGIGLNIITRKRLVLGMELKYQLGLRFKRGVDLPVNDLEDNRLDVASIQRHQRPPRGFSWDFHFGYRF